jgi:ATP dependent DNA ligase domain
MLAQLDARLPRVDGWAYEPKMDGFRGQLWRRDAAAVQLLSRNARDLGPWFPEIIRAAKVLPPNTLLDGEIVVADETGMADFGELQHRLTLARKFIADGIQDRPAILLVFAVLELVGEEFASRPLAIRRDALERFLESRHPCLQLVTHTIDREIAEGDYDRCRPFMSLNGEFSGSGTVSVLTMLTPRALGVEEFAVRRGRRYGTILIDVGTRRPIELLEDPSSDALVGWLSNHPGVEIVCRDRDGVASVSNAAHPMRFRWLTAGILCTTSLKRWNAFGTCVGATT